MKKTFAVALLVSVVLTAPAMADPTVADAAHALEKAWLQIASDGSKERSVAFEAIDAGPSNGDSYPFRVTATVRDYNAGYPPNGYFGQTCTMRFKDEVFTLRPDSFGGWEVAGRMTVFDDNRCEDNPSEGVSSIPAESIAGQPASAFGAARAAEPLRAEDRRITEGPWTCYGVGGAILFGFDVTADGAYSQNGEAGAFVYDRGAAAITFTDGPLGGQAGRGMDGHTFQLTDTVSCEAQF